MSLVGSVQCLDPQRLLAPPPRALTSWPTAEQATGSTKKCAHYEQLSEHPAKPKVNLMIFTQVHNTESKLYYEPQHI